jgi:UDP-N-acetylmuramoyl-tripeptide--D-alanyl-D-alanine ligase
MAKFARTVRPDIAVWISVAKTHTMMFGTLETTAREKSLLVEALPRSGTAILNDDNPYIAAYEPRADIKTIYCGDTARSRVSASNASSRWPERLSFRARVDDEVADFKTQFVGEHWVSSILPALAVARLAGISLRDAAEALSRYEPMPKRMSPQLLPNGAMMLRDERNGSVDTLRAALKVMGDATAARKFLVLTDVSDSPQKPRRRLTQMGRDAAKVADAVMFVGEHSEHGARGAIEGGMSPDQVWSYYNIEDAAERLRAELREDDLVMLRGRRVDHMQRLYLNLVQDVKCWRNRCNKSTHCEVCHELARPRRRIEQAGRGVARFVPDRLAIADIRARFRRTPKGDRL